MDNNAFGLSLLDSECGVPNNAYGITVFDLIGPQGATGDVGPTGPQGAAGAQGATGAASGAAGSFSLVEDFCQCYNGASSLTVFNFSSSLGPATFPTNVAPSALQLYPFGTGTTAGNRTVVTAGYYFQAPPSPVNGTYGFLSNYSGPTAATYDCWGLGRCSFSTTSQRQQLTFSPFSLLPSGEARFSSQIGFSDGGFGGLGGTASSTIGEMLPGSFVGLALFSDILPTSTVVSPSFGGTGIYVRSLFNTAQALISKDFSGNVTQTFSLSDDTGLAYWDSVNVYEDPETIESNPGAYYSFEIKMTPTDVEFSCYSNATTILFQATTPLYPGSDVSNWSGYLIKGMSKALASRADNIAVDYVNFHRIDSSTSARGQFF